MNGVNLWIFIGCGIVLLFTLDVLLKKLLGVKKRRSVHETSGKKAYQWVRGVAAVVFVSLLWPVLSLDSPFYQRVFWVSFLVIMTGIEVWFEYRYIKASRQFIKTLALGSVLITFALFIQ
ncbi:DUF4181 domain-containing protein [Halobacillus litoralis]|uniref:DUF4181 domain-containing protein n=1 Tax=Halobacillus litoralis TaxID=45668 RepID=A0A845DQI7_9BACI|nr:DUF4181 domain-containing protein [Halobacillus litoralis]